MRSKLIPCATVVRVLLCAALAFLSVAGHPSRWRNFEMNTTASVDDPEWKELVIWSNETLKDEPLLNAISRNHSLPRVLSAEELENQTLKQFELLKVNYSRLIHELDDELKDDLGSGRHLPRIVDKTLRLLNLKQVVSELETSVMSKVSCTACKAGVGLLLHEIRSGKSADDIIKMSFRFCVSLKIQTPRVCDGVTQLFGGEVVYVLKRVIIGPDEICSFIIGDACGDIFNPTHEWDVVFPPVPKPNVATPKAPIEVASPNSASFKVLHLSDTHFDPYYEEGTNAECNEPLCCRLTNGPAKNAADGAGRWGDYRKCDTPKRTIDHMFQHISSTHTDIDYILWTGDLPPHDIWNQTQEENLNILKLTVNQIKTYFPGIPVFSSIGNHESAPVNSFPLAPVSDFGISWLYDELDKQWRLWLPTSTSKTVRKGAFYSVLVRPGFRIISLNMNYCNNKNWWLLLNSTDPAKELQWFIYELQSAEFNDEKVHVIGHIPPGHSDCLKVWSRNYYSIIARYEATITAQFFGHTHFDEFELFYDPKDLGRAVGISYICPSVTPFTNLNPGYRIYYVDGDRDHSTRAVLDHETWVMNLKEANLYGYPIWYKLYSARDSYQMTNLMAQDWDKFVTKMTDNDELFDQYYKHYWKNSPVRPPCDLECRKRMICDLRSGRSHDRKTFCQEIESRIDANHPTGWKAWLYNGLALSNATDNDTMSGTEESDYSGLLDSFYSYTEDTSVESTTLDVSDVDGITEIGLPTDEPSLTDAPIQSSNTIFVKELPSNSASTSRFFYLQFNIVIVIFKLLPSKMMLMY